MYNLNLVQALRPIYLTRGIRYIENGELIKALDEYKELIKVCPEECHQDLIGDFKLLKTYNFQSALMLAEKAERDKLRGFDYFFHKALILNPSNEPTSIKLNELQAISNREYDNLLTRINAKKELYTNLPPSSKYEISKEQQYKIIHTTSAMEGNSFSLDEVIYFLYTGNIIHNRTDSEHQEIIGASSAIDYINKNFPPNMKSIDLIYILQIHNHLASESNIIDPGKLRSQDVIIATHLPPEFEKVQSCMDDFVDWLGSEATSLHPIDVAARVHQTFVEIHPFTDGNGRTARMLMNIVLRMNGFLDVDIPPMTRSEDYYSTIKMGTDNYLMPFTRLLMECIDVSLDYFLEKHLT